MNLLFTFYPVLQAHTSQSLDVAVATTRGVEGGAPCDFWLVKSICRSVSIGALICCLFGRSYRTHRDWLVPALRPASPNKLPQLHTTESRRSDRGESWSWLAVWSKKFLLESPTAGRSLELWVDEEICNAARNVTFLLAALRWRNLQQGEW